MVPSCRCSLRHYALGGVPSFKERVVASLASPTTHSSANALIFLAGTPPTTMPASTFFVTTAPAATRQPWPIVTPAVTVTWAASQQPLPITMGADFGTPYRKERPCRVCSDEETTQ